MNDVIPLFSTPLYFSKIKNLDFNEITFQINQTNFKEKYEGLSVSTEKNAIDLLPNLKQNLINHVNIFLFERLNYIPFNYYFSESWFVRINSLGKSSKHLHANSLYSGVVYLDVPDEGGEIKFYSVETISSKNTVKHMFNTKENNIFNSDSWYVNPKCGDIIIFPSYVLHEVTKNISNNYRYSFAFNILPEVYKSSSLLQ